MNCSEFDDIYYEMINHITTTSQIFWITTLCCVSILSLSLLVAGERIVRPTTAE